MSVDNKYYYIGIVGLVNIGLLSMIVSFSNALFVVYWSNVHVIRVALLFLNCIVFINDMYMLLLCCVNRHYGEHVDVSKLSVLLVSMEKHLEGK